MIKKTRLPDKESRKKNRLQSCHHADSHRPKFKPTSPQRTSLTKISKKHPVVRPGSNLKRRPQSLVSIRALSGAQISELLKQASLEDSDSAVVCNNLTSRLSSASTRSNKNKAATDTSSEEQTCVICMSALRRKAFKRLGCGHSFHKQCVDQWLDSAANCPQCRQPVFQIN